MKVTVRPATRDDLLRYSGEERLGPTATAFIGEIDGEPVGIGGLAYRAGRVYAFCDLKPEAKQHPKALHAAALAVIKLARDLRHRFVFAEMDLSEPTAPRWLARLGFERLSDEGAEKVIWVWRNSRA